MLKSLLYALFLVVVLCGCESAQPFSPTTNIPTSLHIVRLVDMNKLLPPLDRTITNEQAIQQIYAKALELPLIPNKIVSCPIDLGILYHLTFLHTATVLHTINLFVTGCGHVQIDHTPPRMLNETFSTLVATALGIPSLRPSDICVFQHKCSPTNVA